METGWRDKTGAENKGEDGVMEHPLEKHYKGPLKSHADLKEREETMKKIEKYNMTLSMAPEEYEGSTVRTRGTYRSSAHTSIMYKPTHRKKQTTKKYMNSEREGYGENTTSRSSHRYCDDTDSYRDEEGQDNKGSTRRSTSPLVTKWDRQSTTRKITSARIKELQALEQEHLRKLEELKKGKGKDYKFSFHYESTPRGYGTYELLRIADNKFRSLKDEKQTEDRSYFLNRRIMGGLHAPIPFKTTTQAMYPAWDKKHYPRRAKDDPSNFNRREGQFSKFVDICVSQGVDYRANIPPNSTVKKS